LTVDTECVLGSRVELSFSEGFALWDADDRLVMCNSPYREMYAPVGSANLQPGTLYWDHAVAMVRSGATHVPPEEAEEFAKQRIASRQNRGPLRDVPRQNGRWVRATARPVMAAPFRSALT